MPVIILTPRGTPAGDGMGIDDALKRARTAEAIAHGKLLIMLRADIQIQTVKKVPTTKRSCPSAASYRVECLYGFSGGIQRLFVDYTCGLLLRCTNCRSYNATDATHQLAGLFGHISNCPLAKIGTHMVNFDQTPLPPIRYEKPRQRVG
jgi:hypothetical protein